MRTNCGPNGGFTLVEIMIVVAIISLLAIIAIPNYVHARSSTQGNACIENLRLIDSAIQQWALEQNKGGSAAIDPESLNPYLKPGKVPKCPTGVDYLFSETVGVTPSVTCPVGDDGDPAHILPEGLQ